MSDNTDHGAAVQVRLRGDLYTDLENWRRSQPKILARSEALRRLLRRALSAETTVPCGRREAGA
jgi:hypothetical protein